MTSAALSGGGFVTAPPQSVGDELPAASQSTLLLQKKKEMAEVQQQLDRKKDEFRQRMQRCQEKEVELAAKQEGLKEQVRKFDKFLKENDAKRVRANRKAMEEVKLRDQKDRDLQELLVQLQRQQEQKVLLQEELQRKAVCETFLERVCDAQSDQYEEISQIIARYETLEAANQDLRAAMDQQVADAEAQAAELTNYVRKTQTKALEYNSDIAEKQQWLKQKRLELQDTEADLYRHESAAKEGSRQLGEIQMAIHNIYLRCRVRGRQEETGEAAVLEAIKSRVTDLQAIVATLQPYLLQAQAAAAAALEASKQTALDFASRQNDGSPPGARGSVAVAAASTAAQPGTVAYSRAPGGASAAPQSAALQSASGSSPPASVGIGDGSKPRLA